MELRLNVQVIWNGRQKAGDHVRAESGLQLGLVPHPVEQRDVRAPRLKCLQDVIGEKINPTIVTNYLQKGDTFKSYKNQ